MRRLAQRSADAARDTSEKIEFSVGSSKQARENSVRVSQTLEQILNKANELDETVAAIASSSANQLTGVERIDVAIQQIETATQATAANTEESASAAEELH